MTTAVRYPPSPIWPGEMRAPMAAAYVDEPSVEAFLSKVRSGVYPCAARGSGSQQKWAKVSLDQTIAKRHGAQSSTDDNLINLI